MAENIGTKTRPSSACDYPMAVDWSLPDVFGTNQVTSCTVVATAIQGTGGSGVTVVAPTIGTVTVSSNVATFEVSGGTAGDCSMLFTATNGASPPNVVQFAGTLRTL